MNPHLLTQFPLKLSIFLYQPFVFGKRAVQSSVQLFLIRVRRLESRLHFSVIAKSRIDAGSISFSSVGVPIRLPGISKRT